MTTSPRTAIEVATEAFGGELDTLNWTTDQGECQPWRFDNGVLRSAARVRRTLTPEEEVRVAAYVAGESELYDDVIDALRGRLLGGDSVTACLIIAMYWLMKAAQLADDPGPYPEGTC